ncbi:hypothetical protein PIB30_078970 [Stylosanthes scabra]|uniref:Uncharacterized protein n=1 Tax=Stylosanthes scabra TaxID=79078 RepID=A0ABU6UPS8_9FABA|nr:hypothetical protein [Stylosanthes scabra]
MRRLKKGTKRARKSSERSKLYVRIHVQHGIEELNLHVVRELYALQEAILGSNPTLYVGVTRHTWEPTTTSSNSFNFIPNPRPFGHQFHSLIKGMIERIKRRLIED